MGLSIRSSVLVYLFGVLTILLYKAMQLINSSEVLLEYLFSDQRTLYMVIILPVMPSIATYVIIRSLENNFLKKIYVYNDSISKLRNMIDAYALVMRQHDESIEDIRSRLNNLSSKEYDLEKRLLAIEKLIPILIDLYKDKERKS